MIRKSFSDRASPNAALAAKPKVSRERELLISSLRCFFDQSRTLPDMTDLNWSQVMRLASAHGVTSMLASGLRRAALPEAVRTELRTALRENAHRSLTLSAELARLASAFRIHVIDFVPVRGPILSEQLHGNLSMRSSVDIDILVHERDLLRSRDVLTSLRYRLSTTVHWQCDSAYLRSRDGELSFTNADRAVCVDLHWRLLPSCFANPFDHIDVWGNLVPTRFAGGEMLTLRPEHPLLLLCAHGAKHAFARLCWICDIACCMSTLSDYEWGAVLDASSRAGSMRQLLVGLRTAARLFEVPLPPGLPDDSAVDSLVESITDRAFGRELTAKRSNEDLAFCFAVQESPFHRARYILGHLLIPSPAEYEALKLPPSLYLFYYPIRLGRLTAKWIVG